MSAKDAPNHFSHNADGTLDELWAEGRIHIEQMNDGHWWIGIDQGDGRTLHVNFWTPRARIRANYLVEHGTSDWFEGGEFDSGIKCADRAEVSRRTDYSLRKYSSSQPPVTQGEQT